MVEYRDRIKTLVIFLVDIRVLRLLGVTVIASRIYIFSDISLPLELAAKSPSLSLPSTNVRIWPSDDSGRHLLSRLDLLGTVLQFVHIPIRPDQSTFQKVGLGTGEPDYEVCGELDCENSTSASHFSRLRNSNISGAGIEMTRPSKREEHSTLYS